MTTSTPPSKIKLSWMDVLFRSLSVVIPVLLETFVEIINNPNTEVESTLRVPGSGTERALKERLEEELNR